MLGVGSNLFGFGTTKEFVCFSGTPIETQQRIRGWLAEGYRVTFVSQSMTGGEAITLPGKQVPSRPIVVVTSVYIEK